MLHKVKPQELNSVMEFDTVIYSDGNGRVETVFAIWPPELYNYLGKDGKHHSALDGPWELMNGYSGQDSYSGPIMHDSEFIGGRMATDILETEGYYVALIANYFPEEEDGEIESEGWAVARVLPDNVLIKGTFHYGNARTTFEGLLDEFWDSEYSAITPAIREHIHSVNAELIRTGKSESHGWWTLELVS